LGLGFEKGAGLAFRQHFIAKLTVEFVGRDESSAAYEENYPVMLLALLIAMLMPQEIYVAPAAGAVSPPRSVQSQLRPEGRAERAVAAASLPLRWYCVND
jgi:hypothetical protein